MAMTTDSFSSEQFALRWNDFSHNLSSGFSSHLNTKNLVDVTLAVEGQLLEAHKLVLSVCSPFFENIFKVNPCQHPVVVLQDMKYSEVDALVKFMYQGEVNVKQEDLARFLKVAEVLKIKGLTLDKTLLQNSAKNNDDLLKNSNNLQADKSLDNNNTMQEHSKSVQQGRKKHDRSSDNLTKKSSKRIRKTSITLDNSTDKISIPKLSPEIKPENNCINNNQVISTKNILPAECLNKKKTLNNDGSIDLTKDDDDSEFIEYPELGSANIINNFSRDTSCIEPVTYRLSARGKPQLIHRGYVYNLTSRSAILNRSHYRCAEQHRGCRGKCAVMAEQFMPTGVSDHNHPPGFQTDNDFNTKKSS
ncbi:hypothetical protein PV325_011483 [Microctonus aethiopoides]|nr:hypothetical protein PV325_011483 [Microctonus aethiopoides]